MAAEALPAHLRLLTPLLIGWMAWAVHRAPSQGRSNRLLAAFLGTIALGYTVDAIGWELGFAPSVWRVTRALALLAGLADPILLFAFAATFPRPPPWWRADVFLAAALPVAALLAAAQLGLPEAPTTFEAYRWAARWGELAFVNGLQAAAFLLLLHRFAHERRRFLSKQLFHLALGTGFVALSRASAVVWVQSLGWLGAPDPIPSLLVGIGYGSFFVLLAFAAAGLACLAWLRTAHRSPVRLLAVLAGILAAFLVAWPLVVERVPGGDRLFTIVFSFRWVVFAAIVGYGLLRHQIFDFAGEAWNTAAYAAAAFAAVGLLVLVDWHDGAQETVAARLGLLLAGAAAFGGVQALLRRLGRALRRPGRPAARRQVLLDIYEATLEQAVERNTWNAGERRLVETLRNLFQVSEAEHRAILSRLKAAG